MSTCWSMVSINSAFLSRKGVVSVGRMAPEAQAAADKHSVAVASLRTHTEEQRKGKKS